MGGQRDSNDGPGQDADAFAPEDAWPVCPKCFHPCNPLQDYCDHCDSNEPMNPLASYMPFERIRFDTGMYGKAWRKMCGDDTSMATRLLCLIVIVFGAPIMLFVGLPFLLISKIEDAQLRRIMTAAFFALLTGLIMAYVLRDPWA